MKTEKIQMRYLKHQSNGRILPYTVMLAARNDMIECDAKGDVLQNPPPKPAVDSYGNVDDGRSEYEKMAELKKLASQRDMQLRQIEMTPKEKNVTPPKEEKVVKDISNHQWASDAELQKMSPIMLFAKLKSIHCDCDMNDGAESMIGKYCAMRDAAQKG